MGKWRFQMSVYRDIVRSDFPSPSEIIDDSARLNRYRLETQKRIGIYIREILGRFAPDRIFQLEASAQELILRTKKIPQTVEDLHKEADNMAEVLSGILRLTTDQKQELVTSLKGFVFKRSGKLRKNRRMYNAANIR